MITVGNKMANNLRQHKIILYRLKRNFGESVVFSIPTTNDYNVTTGAVTRVFTTVTVRKAIVLPSRTTREFVYDLSFIASNKNFTYGGMFDKSVRNVIVMKKDLDGHIPELNWLCTFKSKEYTVKEVNDTEDGAGYLLICNTLDKED